MYYFLDMDGVLNRESDWRKPFTVNPACLDSFRTLLRCDRNPVIVLSSTWRTNLDAVTPYFRVDDITPNTAGRKTRQEEIEFYIRRKGIKDYLIIDDDRTLFSNPENLRIYFTNHKTGLTNTDVKRIITKYL